MCPNRVEGVIKSSELVDSGSRENNSPIILYENIIIISLVINQILTSVRHDTQKQARNPGKKLRIRTLILFFNNHNLKVPIEGVEILIYYKDTFELGLMTNKTITKLLY